jgi:hypothetical protein
MQGSWRLVNGEELYDISSDPGQENDLAKIHPNRVHGLRADYEKWWDGLQPAINHSPSIVVCSPSGAGYRIEDP